MSLSKEALDAVAKFRRNVSENPTNYSEEELNLKKVLLNLVERDKKESRGKYVEKIFDPYLNYKFKDYNFSSSSKDSKFNKEEYLLAEYLYAPSFKLQISLIEEWKNHLKDITDKAFKENEDLKNSYEKISRFSKDWLLLKQKSLVEQIDRKTLFAVNFFKKSIDENSKSNDWILPSDFRKRLNIEFQKSSYNFLKSWGYSDENADLYLKIVKEAVKDKKILTYAAIAGGAVLAAYGLGRSSKNLKYSSQNEVTQYSREIANYSSQMVGGAFKSKPMAVDYGVLSQPEFLTIPYGQVHANQLGFQSFLQGMNSAENLSLQSLKTAGDILTTHYDYGGNNINNADIMNKGLSGLETAVGAALGSAFNQNENMLGSPTTLSVLQLTDNMASINGSIGGQPFNKTINKIGNAINVM